MTETRTEYQAGLPMDVDELKPLTEFKCPLPAWDKPVGECGYDLLKTGQIRLETEMIGKAQRVICPMCGNAVLIEVVATVPQLAKANAWPERSTS